MIVVETIFANWKLLYYRGRYEALYNDLTGKSLVRGEKVFLWPDGHGFISPGILHAGPATIMEISPSPTDTWLFVKNNRGESDWVKPDRVERLFERSEDYLK